MITSHYNEELGNGIKLNMVQIPAGTFLMGSPNYEIGRYSTESPRHRVTVPAFFMSIYPITQAQYTFMMGDNPAFFKGADKPVEGVSWHAAVEFCRRLSEQLGKIYRLPREAEWEYACRAGTTTPFFYGESLAKTEANYCSESTTEVGSYPANGFGLYDMHGNVGEWCLDRWHDNYQGAPTDGSEWVANRLSNKRVIRGGSWANSPRYCRSAYRYTYSPKYRYMTIGFRVVCEVKEL